LLHEHIDYFIFGHRHLPMIYKLNNQSNYINLGDWIDYNTYLELDENEVTIKSFTDSSANYIYNNEN